MNLNEWQKDRRKHGIGTQWNLLFSGKGIKPQLCVILSTFCPQNVLFINWGSDQNQTRQVKNVTLNCFTCYINMENIQHYEWVNVFSRRSRILKIVDQTTNGYIAIDVIYRLIYVARSRSSLCLQMPWHLTMPGHQQALVDDFKFIIFDRRAFAWYRGRLLLMVNQIVEN